MVKLKIVFMKNLTWSIFILLGLVCCSCNKTKVVAFNEKDRTVDFNLNWEFYKLSDKESLLNYDCPPENAQWQGVDVPHDWSIELPFIEPVEKKDENKKLTVVQLGGHLGKRSTGYLDGGTGWYRKKFKLSDNIKNKNIRVDFDGVYMYSDCWINGVHLGHHHYGYTAFSYDLTPHLKTEGENVLWVRAKNNLESRWYSGSGIYRPVKLTVTNDQCIEKWGTYVTTPKVTKKEAQIKVNTTIANKASDAVKVELRSFVLDEKGQKVIALKSVSQRIKGNSKISIDQTESLDAPQLWDINNPYLYQLISEVHVEGELKDVYKTRFGVRKIEFNAQQGFLLNDRKVLLKGVCIHHDNGILGAKSYQWSEERKILKLKEMGANAIRFSHNPPSEVILDLCDKHGMLAIDEAFDEWRAPKAHGYAKYFDSNWRKDICSMVLRDRNHPSIIMWSIGNEIIEQGMPVYGGEIAKMIADYVKELDPTRPTTHAVQPGGGRMGNHFPYADYFDAVDVAGYNYERWSYKGQGNFVENHKTFPKRIMYQSESAGKYLFDNWMKMIDNEFLCGDFIWTGIDYLGEVGCGKELNDQKKYPAYIASCGSMEHTLFPKPRFYYTQVLWKEEPVVSINVQKKLPYKISSWGFQPAIASWNWNRTEEEICTVDVYSNCEEVELLHNGKSLGRKRTSRKEAYTAQWKVPYIKGELKALGYRSGKQVKEDVIQTANKPSRIKMSVDRKTLLNTGADVAYIVVEAVDENGLRNTLEKSEIEFSINGAAKIIAVGNGSHYAPLNHPFVGNTGVTHEGRLLVVVKSSTEVGNIELKAVAKNLQASTVRIKNIQQ
jgi:beta-galactosidase